MPRLLAIYNICGLQGWQNTPYYESAIRSLLNQKGFEKGELKVVLSSCCATDHCMNTLQHVFQDDISYNWIGDSLPLTVTFNHTVMKSVEALGEFDGYLYVDSGINFWDPSKRWDALVKLWRTHLKEEKENRVAITAAMPCNDDGRQWWGITYPEDGIYYYRPAQTTNLHCQIYSEEFRKAYGGKLHCDIFANDTSESVTTYLTSAIGKRFAMTTEIEVFHNAHLDGASFGWRGGEGVRKRLFQTDKSMDERYFEGQKYGFGYEECNGNMNWIHDPEKFDADGMALDPNLHEFLKKELFLSKEQFNYEGIAHYFRKGS